MPKGDPFKKVRTGDRLRVPATAYNAFIDTALDSRARRQNTSSQDTPTFRQAGIIQVKNCTGENRERFDVLGVDDPIFLPDENEDSFKNRVMFDGVVPVDPDHKGKFVVLLEPLKPNAIGLACIDGVCPAWVTLPDPGAGASPQYADIADGDATALHAGNSGGAQILWLDPALTAGQSGWAVVRIGASAEPQRLIPVTLTQDGGADNTDGTATPTYTYKWPTDLDGHEILNADGSCATGLSPLWARSFGSYKPASHGMACIDGDGNPQLWSCDEAENVCMADDSAGSTDLGVVLAYGAGMSVPL